MSGAEHSASAPEKSAYALYVHIPWCVRKCPYCDFNSHEFATAPPFKAYFDVLKTDLCNEVTRLQQTLSDDSSQGFGFDTVFFGGGTPSLVPPAFIADFLEWLHRKNWLKENAEITLEANPGTVLEGTAENHNLAAFAGAGVNRCSLGIQSFDPLFLRALGRIHSGDQALQALDTAARSFPTFNVDLMYALPGQSPAQAERDLREALQRGVPHLSWYQLTIEANTYFYSHTPGNLPNDDRIADMEMAGHALLHNAALDRYEISAYARAGHRCKHNVHYWRFNDYLGIGAGAHGKITLADGVVRTRKRRQPDDYLRNATSIDSKIASDDVVFEFLLGGLRLRDGISLQALANLYDKAPATSGKVQHQIDALIRDGLLIKDNAADTLATTQRGYRFLDEVLTRLLD